MFEIQIEENLGVKALTTVIMNFESHDIEDYGSLFVAIERGEIW